MNNIMERNAEGIVTACGNGVEVTAKIPRTRSALGMIASNGLINGGDYREDGLVYFEDVPVRKWHIHFDGIRVWEPKFQDLVYLHSLYRRTQDGMTKAWERVREVLHAIYATRAEGEDTAIAHARPTHKFDWQEWKPEPWWKYNIQPYVAFGHNGLSFSFDWVEGRPKKLINVELGQRLHELEKGAYANACHRSWKARVIFFEAMKRHVAASKPLKPTVRALRFGDDTFWFRSEDRGPGCVWWEMFDERYAFEVQDIV